MKTILNEIKIHRPTIVEESVFRSAESFHIAAIAIKDVDELKYNSCPFITNASLAIELYLKSFISHKYFANPTVHKLKDSKCNEFETTSYKKVYSRSESKAHDLLSLYKQLPQNVMSDFELKAKAYRITPTDFFEEHKHCFIQWRYSFEGNAKRFCVSDALNIMRIFREIGNSALNIR
ncbi:hypothetical protein OQ486_13545 [Plesiomonas shigelloides]|uniref:hypothetical protein n=1 Tax=Plesiomonas shigelloides TaxID=703 RepID=UPI002247494B|nr:hypothetical protein [Plesiomonas shigelloides]MCX2534487.1 hypothetical protein [Plesiomonas shigelloides]